MTKLFAALITVALVISLAAASAPAAKIDGSNDMSWLDGFTLVVLDTDDISSLHTARATIQSHGGRVAIMSPPSMILGWIPIERRAELIGQAGIREIYYTEVMPGEVDAPDFQSRAMVKFFNAAARGDIQRKHFEEMSTAEAMERGPIPNDALRRPDLGPDDYGDYIKNLEAVGLDVARLKDRGILLEKSPAYGSNSLEMTGTIALTIFMVESNGTIDPDTYTWSQEHMDGYVMSASTGLAFWSAKAYENFDCWNAFLVHFYPGTDPRCQQGYEPIIRTTNITNTWINTIIGHFGYTSGTVFQRVDAYNTWQRSNYGTDWAYSAFVAYNPPPAATQYLFGGSAWAYLGGPFAQLLYRSYGWDPSQVFPHETGHIFNACDEYAESGCSCDCNGHLNRNCENCVGYPHGSCMMNNNVFGLCQYTPEQVGWTGTGCAPAPLAAPVAALATPDNDYQGVTTTITISGSNFVYGAYVEMGSDITLKSLNFINSNTFEATITIDNDAALGLRNIVVRNRDLQSSTITNGFEVKETTRHYVAAAGAGVFPYITPANAATTLAAALAATGAGDSLLVASTTFTNVDLTIARGVKMYGAWDGGFASRDLATGKTVLDLSGNLEIGPATTAESVIDGFEIRNGSGSSQVAPIAGKYGGGVWVYNSTATIANSYIHDCQAHNGTYGAGGGIYGYNSSLTLIDNEISLCSSGQGGAVYVDGGSLDMSGCTIQTNSLLLSSSQPALGGGVFVANTPTASFSGNTIDGNTADPGSPTGSGGGVCIKNSTDVSMDGDIISNNVSGLSGSVGYGGGIHVEGSHLTMTGVTLDGNQAKTIGGGIDNDAGSTLSMTGCKILDNSALIGGGAYLISLESFVNHNLWARNSGTACYLLNATAGSFNGNTMNANSGAPTGAAYFSNTAIPVINNVIANSTGNGLTCSGATSPAPLYCDVWNSSGADFSGVTPGAGCISQDPLFVAPASDDYHLAMHSPLIDGGDPDPAFDDPDGSRADMGIYGSHAFVMDHPVYVKNLSASITGGNAILKWSANPELNMAGYAVYKDVDGSFVPSAANFVTTVAAPDTSYDDGTAVAGTFYKVSAVNALAYAGGYGGPVEPVATGIGDDVAAFENQLYQNHPNPFNPTTRIRYEISTRTNVSLVVFDVQGRRIKTLVDEVKSPGQFTAQWDGTNSNGARVSTGVYFYRLSAGGFDQTMKMVMLK